MSPWKRMIRFIDAAWPLGIIIASFVGMVYMAVNDVFMAGIWMMFFIFFSVGIYEMWDGKRKVKGRRDSPK